MSLRLMYITNKPEIAKIAEDSGVDWIFVDLEVIGKEERQGHLDTVKSKHSISDISKVKSVLEKSKVLVRTNPINVGSKNEIDEVIQAGADIIMLPYFKKISEVKEFISLVDGRVKVMLLLETVEAVDILDDILELKNIDAIHIGLNDLHLEYNKNFMFELLVDGTVEKVGNKILKAGIPFGFGGTARIGEGILPAENIISEHYRLKSSMVILSRSFYNVNETRSITDIKNLFKSGVKEIRDFERSLIHKESDYFRSNRITVKNQVDHIISIKSAGSL